MRGTEGDGGVDPARDGALAEDASLALDAQLGGDGAAPIELDGGGSIDLDAGDPDGGPPPLEVDGGPPRPPLPPLSAVFSRRPADDAPDTAVEDAIVSLIDRAVPGSIVRIAVYTFTRDRVTDALVAAHARGVDVRVVLDGGSDTGAGVEAPRLIAGLGADRVHLCDAPGTACVGSGIMHDKISLFSELDDGSRDVVVQASHNFTNNQLHLHNNAVIIAGDAALFAAYLETWDDLDADAEIPNYYRIADGDLATRAYFFPRTDGDTVVSILGNVECDGTSRIRVAMAFFTDARDEVARALAARRADGCSVEVVVGDDEIPVGDRVATILRDGGVRVVRYPARTAGWGLHSKYLLIDSPYAGSAGHRRLVFTGSHNWTGPALTINDEALLRVEDGAIFDAFMADWAHIAASAVRP